jgi:major membrane immunogen (membrane-anchored lipoprotein)
MLLKPTLLTLAFMSAALLGGCGKDEATKFCLSDEGTHQDCGIACTISKDQDACKKWEKMTIELCDKVGKQPCQEICEADKNEYACTKAKSM